MSLRVKFKKGEISLILSHNKKLHKIFTILEFISILAIVLGILVMFLYISNQKLIFSRWLIPLLLWIGFLGIIPDISLKGREEGLRQAYVYMVVFLFLIFLKYGRFLPMLLQFSRVGISSLTTGLTGFIISGLIFTDLLYIMAAGAVIGILMTFIIWGLSFNNIIKNMIIPSSFSLGFVLLNLRFHESPYSLAGLIGFIVIGSLIGILLGYFERSKNAYGTFASLIFTFLLLCIYTGIPFSLIPLALVNGDIPSLFRLIMDGLILISIMLITWISIVSIQDLTGEIRNRKFTSALTNIAIGTIISIIALEEVGIYVRNVNYTFSFLLNLGGLLYVIIILFVIAFLGSLLGLIFLGSNKYTTQPIFFGFFSIMVLAFYSYFKDAFIPSILFIGIIVIFDSTISGGVSEIITSRYLGGASILDRSAGQAKSSQVINENRPPLCWAKSRSLEGYVINSVIGVKSGFGYVLDGYDPASKRRVAIKILKEASEDGTPIAFDAETLNKFNEEHERLKNLKGVRNVVSIFDTHLPEIERYSGPNRLEAYIRSPPYIVMEFLTGGSLSDAYDIFSKAEYLPPFLLLIYGIANGLYEAHSKGILHGDIKPDNIMFASIGKYTIKSESVDPERLKKALIRGYLIPKLTDFGTAKVMKAGKTTFSTATIHYAPPEILVGQNVIDQRYDIYELGLVMYYELAGAVGGPEKSLAINKRQAELAKLINQGQFFEKLEEIIPILENIPLTDLRTLNPGVSERLWLFLRRTIEPNPLKRPRSMKEFSAAIKAIAISDYHINEINNF